MAGSGISGISDKAVSRAGLAELLSCLSLNSLFVRLRADIDAFFVRQPKKGLACALRIKNLLPSRVDIARALLCHRVSLTLTISDLRDKLTDFVEVVLGFQNIIDIFVSPFGDACQFVPKLHDAVASGSQGCFIDAIVSGDVCSLVCTLTERISNGLGGHSLLVGKCHSDSALQRVMKLGEARLDGPAIENCVIKRAH
ncbi:hypothetical protein [Candidatus Mycobacterium methanotrophicum]|uniref:hypothetical protein n=1 Tax=Candidatus Mycobacterium methanotrophicum TaxID=2943498 RepID=UPI001C57B53D|nr:hypothetical protein [Candidatus Mycobacterium methanotrophicum]